MSTTNRFAVIDFETTGLSPQQGDRAIEIGIALFDGHEVIQTYQSLMNPGVPVSYFIESLTGISGAMVNESRPSSVVMREACEIIGGLPIVAHNASFDRKFYIAELNKIGRSYINPFVCTMLIGRRLYPHAPDHKLATLAAINNISTEGHHRALSDAVMTSKLLGVMRRDLMELYEDQAIDSRFLYSYQKKAKHSVRSCVRKLELPTHVRKSPASLPYRSTKAVPIERLKKIDSPEETAIPTEQYRSPQKSGDSSWLLWLVIIIFLIWLVS